MTSQNNSNYLRSISSPEGFFIFLPTSYIARPPRRFSNSNMSFNQPETPVDSNQPQQPMPGLGLVSRLVDNQTIRDSWNNIIQETRNTMSRVRTSVPAITNTSSNSSTETNPSTSLTSLLRSRSLRRPSLLPLGTSNTPAVLAGGGISPTQPQNSDNTPVNTEQVVLDLQFIDQNTTEDGQTASNSRHSSIKRKESSISQNNAKCDESAITISSPTSNVEAIINDQDQTGGGGGGIASTSAPSNIPTTPTSITGEPLPATEQNADGEGEASSPDETTADILRQNPEATALLLAFLKYLPFVIILLAKAFYDHIYGIFLFVTLFVTFRYYNILVKRAATQSDHGVLLPLWIGIVHLSVTISIFYIIYSSEQLYNILIFIPPKAQLITDLVYVLWVVIISDFIIKLSTIIIKIFFTLLPLSLLPITKRGKWYLFIELTSQFYRSLVPIQLWLLYLMESYQGHQKVVGVFLSAAYIVAKGTNIMQVAKAWWKALTKLLDNIQLGVSPTKETLLGVGRICPICHDDFKSPVQLTCCHIFCESCVTKWFDREQTCPLCRAKLVDDPSWRDGSTSYLLQIF